MPTDASTRLAGEPVRLLPERALYWERVHTLVIADVHWGKAATFRAAGVAVPGGGTAADLARLDAALARTGARRLIVLGDLFHARAGRVAPRTLAALREWRCRSGAIEILLVRGNHDRRAGDPPADLRIDCVDAPAVMPPLVLRHEPTESDEGYTVAGHVHPAVILHGVGRQRARLPCCLLGARSAILPAFGGFTGAATVEPSDGDRVFVIAGEEVLPIVPVRCTG